ncbi:hypothetical protein BDA96_07G214900 [Sorghum bicolor]|uniref:BLE2 protein n=3 Tax=Sorghum bicolor TaxID=4558 RepID=A0A1B6PIY9_SORBI|nr:hypothetical protein BDA96_07G214900 [Sorghum bicolor]KXG25595.1 hypothetical protein SORBI_3007G202100 [Sorghum bicolor]
MATAGGAGEVSVLISGAAAVDAAPGGELQHREQTLNSFVRVVAFGEWAGNAFGALAFLWATGVLLGGFCSDLEPLDFWSAMVIIFIEAFRIFSRDYKLDNLSLFGTTKALRWINVSFARMLGRPQEGNEVVLFMGLLIDLVTWLPVVAPMSMGILQAALLILMSKMKLRGASQLTSQSRRRRRLLLWAVLVAFLIVYALWFIGPTKRLLDPSQIVPFIKGKADHHRYSFYDTKAFSIATASAEILTMVVAALLLISRPPIVANLTNTPWGRCLLSLAKVISVLILAFGSVLVIWPPALTTGGHVVDPNSFIISFTTLVLSLGSLQSPLQNTDNPSSLSVGRWIDVILHILFLCYMTVEIPILVLSDLLGARLFAYLAAGLSFILLVAVLLIENFLIPAAVIQVVLSSLRIQRLHSDYHRLSKEDSPSPNMLPAIEVFYVLAICQGSFYITASIIGLFSFFPRRMLVRQSKLRGQQGAKAIDLYYESAYLTCMEIGLFSTRKTVSLARFAKESLSSKTSDRIQLAGVLILDSLLHENKETKSSQHLRTKIIRSNKTLSTLICMLGWEDVRHRDTRLTAARVIANIADRLTVAEIPGTLKMVSSLLDAGNDLPADQEASAQIASCSGGNAGSQHTDGQLGRHDKQGGCYWVRRYWQRMKDKWSILEELPLTHQDSLPILGMAILEKLAHDPDNCAEISRATYLISKIIGLISYTTDSKSSNDEQQRAVICASLNFVRRLASTGENIGVELRQQLCNNFFLLNNLECVLEDSRSSPEIMKLVIDTLTKLALDEDARKEIGSCKVTISKLMHAFIGKDGASNNYYDQSLRMAAGEALANLTIESPANCLVILEEPGYELIKDLKDMLCEDEYKYVAASLLQNICTHAKDKLWHQDAGNHLSSAFPIVMKNIKFEEGKHLEVLIGIISQICDMIPEPSIHDQLQLQTNKSELVQKLVGALNSNRKPSPEYPRMRRVIVEMTISIVKLCPRYATILREGRMMEALTKIEMTPSKVENYRVFYGNIGVVLESGPSLTALVATAKRLIHSAAPPLNLETMPD